MTKKHKNITILDIIPMIVLATLFVFFMIVSKGSTVSLYNLKNIATQIVPVVVGGLGVIFVVSIGSTDISIGANGALCATIAALAASRYGVGVMLPITIILSVTMGALSGFFGYKIQIRIFYGDVSHVNCVQGLLKLSANVRSDLCAN